MPEFDGVLFSDLHLSPSTERLNELFDSFVDRVEGIRHIACLGDLTEYWIGRAQLKQEHGLHVFRQLERLAKAAKQAILIPGNRDFLIRPQARQAGFEVHRDLYEGEFANVRVALEHGDRFCSRDRKYQRFRWWFRKLPWWMLLGIASPSQLHRIAGGIRKRSAGTTVRKQVSVFGVQPAPIERLIRRGAEIVVGGHVHQPFTREHKSGGRTGRVLIMSDWREEGAVVCTVKDRHFELKLFDGRDFLDFEAPSAQKLFEPQKAPADRLTAVAAERATES